MDINHDIIKAIWSSVIETKKIALADPITKKQIEEDSNCECIESDNNYFVMYYLICIINCKGGLKILRNKLVESKIDEKIINKFLYSLLKLDYKTEKGMFSWNEIEEWNLDSDIVKNPTLKYKFF